MAEQPIRAILEQPSVQADPEPEPTGEYAVRLRQQLERERAKWQAAGMDENVKAVDERLAGLGTVEESEEGYASWKNDELAAELEARGLATSGNKADMVARLEENDAEANV
jgi:hypothetical protein